MYTHIRVLNSGHLARVFASGGSTPWLRGSPPRPVLISTVVRAGCFYSGWVSIASIVHSIAHVLHPSGFYAQPCRSMSGRVCGVPEAKLEHPSLSVGRGAFRAGVSRPHGQGQPPTPPRIPRRARRPRVRRSLHPLQSSYRSPGCPTSNPNV